MHREHLTSLDGIAVFLTGLLTAFLMAFPFLVAPVFAGMVRDFGAASLPALTTLVLSRWFPVALGALTASGPVLGCIPAIPLAHRRRVLVAAFVCGSAAVGVCLVGLYEPIFELVGKIKE
jgi:hypothetical protein